MLLLGRAISCNLKIINADQVSSMQQGRNTSVRVVQGSFHQGDQVLSKCTALGQSIADYINDMDIQLKAVCFDFSKNNAESALTMLEKVRRQMKAIVGKSGCNLKAISSMQRIQSLCVRERFLMRENQDLKDKLKS
jgi:hypothetical protein